ncbi:MAG: AlkZ family DNA glycosylase, partial [Chloroflexi bacterium]|nr:AlkZ family DNA glycosylase [Chloroflexota bacterium]
DLLAFRGTLRTETDITLPGGKRWSPAELEPSLSLARQHFREPASFESLRERIEASGLDEVRARGYAARLLLPLVQVNSDAAYGFDAGGEFVLADTWLGANVQGDPRPEDLVRRYLAAWGPATPADFAAWSGLKGVARWFEALGDDVVILEDERKRRLYDLRDAPRPAGDTPAPPRLLPDFDGVMLGWQDRTRMLSADDARLIANRNLQVPAVVLLDGAVSGTWKLERKRKAATLTIRTFRPLPKPDQSALETEALSLIQTFEPDATPGVSFV